MFKNYLTTAVRNLRKNKAHSFINIAGLSVGMAVAMLIGLWIWDELAFDKYHENYSSIALVMENDTHNGTVNTGAAIALPLYAELRKSYGGDFKHIAMASWNDTHILSVGDKNISYAGTFMGADAPEMFTLRMLEGSRKGLKGLSSMLISQSVAKALFGGEEPMNKLVKLDNGTSFKVAGVYEDLPANTTLHDIAFMAPFDFYQASADGRRSLTDWSDNSLFMYVQVADHADITKLSEKIKDIKLRNAGPAEAKLKPAIFLHPMGKWHLYAEFKNGVNTGGAVQYVWLFGTIGMFVLLLACINFMNLSTARSEKRAKEVGIRKAIGSLRGQLISQFFCESLLTAAFAFCLSLALAWMVLPFFNDVANKQMSMPWGNLLFWIMNVVFTLFTGLVAGSYPALYLSSFNPVKVLKGAFKAGRFASIPRKTLVVLQFAVSVVLIISTVIVVNQVQYAKNRPVGYSREGLVNIETVTGDLYNHFSAVKDELQKSGAVTEMASSSSPATGVNNDRGDVDWTGKDPGMTANFGYIHVTIDYGKTVGWQFVAGRDFSHQFATDSFAVVLNEAAVKFMGLKKPVGETIKFGNKDHRVIGVIKDMVMGSPYEAVKQTIYMGNGGLDDIIMRINPNTSAHDAISKIEKVCKTYSPAAPFNYRFVDEVYDTKFINEERIAKLAGVFAVLAIFISCLGLFGMATFMAEQRIKEIGVRKVLGASVVNLWGLLSKEFVVLVIISLFIAMPVAFSFMSNWLLHYDLHTDISWWVFAVTGAGALAITLITVSYQSIKAALMNPVKSLKVE